MLFCKKVVSRILYAIAHTQGSTRSRWPVGAVEETVSRSKHGHAILASRAPRIYAENESSTLVFTKIAKTAIERVFILIMVTPIPVLFDAGEIARLLSPKSNAAAKFGLRPSRLVRVS